MTARLGERSKITAKGQTTIPKSVRQALGVSYGGEIAYLVDERGVSLVRVEEEADPVIAHFLDFLASDMQRNPRESIVAFPASLVERMTALASGIEVDPNEAIDGPVAL
ncbi:MAG: type II toxin-antitoxin system PrlF family antitoxin [Methylorubrum populi]